MCEPFILFEKKMYIDNIISIALYSHPHNAIKTVIQLLVCF